jgi:hypothetical protein
MPITISDNLTDHGEDLNVECLGYPMAGQDLAYRVYLAVGETLNVFLDAGCDLELEIFGPTSMSLEPCGESNLVTCGISGGTYEVLSWTATEAGYHYVVVESYYTDYTSCPFDLHLSIPNHDTDLCYGTGLEYWCTSNHEITFDWSDAESIVPNMTSNTSTVIPGMVYIFTTVADSGHAYHTFDIPCGDTWYIWGRDWVPGLSSDPPNTFGFSVDGEAEIIWDLGTGFSSWDWDQANDVDISTPWSRTLHTGMHVLHVTGGESLGEEIADHPALGTIVITNNASYTP